MGYDLSRNGRFVLWKNIVELSFSGRTIYKDEGKTVQTTWRSRKRIWKGNNNFFQFCINFFKLSRTISFQFKFAIVTANKAQFINESPEYCLDLADFKSHQNQSKNFFIRKAYLIYFKYFYSMMKCLSKPSFWIIAIMIIVISVSREYMPRLILGRCFREWRLYQISEGFDVQTES